MDIEKLIVSLRSPSWQDLEDPDAHLLEDAVEALSTLWDENERLRDEVERQRRSADNRQHLYENAERAYMKVLAELEQAKREQSRIPEGYALVKLELLEELDNFRDLGPIDRLRELAQADREGRCFVFSFGLGSIAYRIWVHPSGSPGFMTEHKMSTLKDLINAETWDNAYSTRAEAEAALRREQNG